MVKAWGGRFQQDTDPRVEAFTESISFDSRLYEVDVRGSEAHARMLAHVDLISEDECAQICEGLSQIKGEIEGGEFEFKAAHEDIHMHIESALIERIGDVGRKLHTGRQPQRSGFDRSSPLRARLHRRTRSAAGKLSAGISGPL